MSLIPLFGALDIAMGMFQIPIAIQDVVYAASGGKDSQGSPVSRIIQAAIDPSNARKMEYLFGGSVSDGDILIYTSEPLYIDDMYSSGSARRQSFVTYSGFKYRVANIADWSGQTGIYVYLAKRYVQQSGLA